MAKSPAGKHHDKKIMSGLDGISFPRNTISQRLFNLWVPILTINNNAFSLKELYYFKLQRQHTEFEEHLQGPVVSEM